MLTKRDGADLSRTSKNDERTDDLTSLKDNITDDPTISSNMNKRTDDIANSWKKNKRTCYGGGKKLNSLVSAHNNEFSFAREMHGKKFWRGTIHKIFSWEGFDGGKLLPRRITPWIFFLVFSSFVLFFSCFLFYSF